METRVTLAEGTEIGFQEYFVRLQHDVEVRSVRFAGAADTTPTAASVRAITDATTLVIAPSNPIVSIGPILAVPGVADAVMARRARNVAVSPIIGGRALKGPADRMLRELGEEATVVGVARRYRDLAATLVIDDVDAHLIDEIERVGMRAIAMPTIMSEPGVAAALARACHEAGATP
jgi:LPPG:FO 2-phospho-L-lactate transferase